MTGSNRGAVHKRIEFQFAMNSRYISSCDLGVAISEKSENALSRHICYIQYPSWCNLPVGTICLAAFWGTEKYAITMCLCSSGIVYEHAWVSAIRSSFGAAPAYRDGFTGGHSRQRTLDRRESQQP